MAKRFGGVADLPRQPCALPSCRFVFCTFPTRQEPIMPSISPVGRFYRAKRAFVNYVSQISCHAPIQEGDFFLCYRVNYDKDAPYPDGGGCAHLAGILGTSSSPNVSLRELADNFTEVQ